LPHQDKKVNQGIDPLVVRVPTGQPVILLSDNMELTLTGEHNEIERIYRGDDTLKVWVPSYTNSLKWLLKVMEYRIIVRMWRII
jgi:hypothetical protein